MLGQAEHVVGGGKEAQQMKFVKEYIEQHYRENITLESHCLHDLYEPLLFQQLLQEAYGQNFKQYLTDVRMKQAVNCCLQTDLMVYEIADRVGYNNARQFSDMFKKSYRQAAARIQISKAMISAGRSLISKWYLYQLE